MSLQSLTAPTPINTDHDLSSFNSGIHSLDEWLQKRALKNEQSSASRTYVICNGKSVIGYYCLSAGIVTLQESPKKMTRNMPDPIPVMVIGRLAVDKPYQNKGLGKALLRDAIFRTLNASEIVGIAALLVHALTEDAKKFYLSRGFLESPIQPMTLCLPISSIKNL